MQIAGHLNSVGTFLASDNDMDYLQFGIMSVLESRVPYNVLNKVKVCYVCDDGEFHEECPS